MHTGTHASSGSKAKPESRVREFTAMLELEIAGDHIDLPSFPEVALRVRRALANEDVTIDHVVRVVSAEPSLVVRLSRCFDVTVPRPDPRLEGLKAKLQGQCDRPEKATLTREKGQLKLQLEGRAIVAADDAELLRALGP